MTKWEFNDGGRAAAGFEGRTGDCAARAVAIVTGLSYLTVCKLLNQYGARERKSKRKSGRSDSQTGVYSATLRRMMKDLGWDWVATTGIGSGCKVHLRADELPKGKIICRVTRHYTAVVDGVIQDTYNPDRGGTRCVYGFWINNRGTKLDETTDPETGQVNISIQSKQS